MLQRAKTTEICACYHGKFMSYEEFYRLHEYVS